MKNDLVTVLDLGSTKIACLAATPTGPEGMKIHSVATTPCKGIRRGIVTDIEETANAIDVVLRRIQQDVQDDITSVVVGISGAQTEGVNSQGFKPIVPRGRMITHQDVMEVLNHSRALVLPAEREQLQALPREFRIDGQRDVRKPIGMTGGKLEVVTYVVTGSTAAIQSVERTVARAGRKIDHMVLQALASGIGVLTSEELEQGAAVVDIGGGTTDIAIFTSGSIAFSASIPIGTQMVSSDLSKLLRTSLEEAERLKIESGSSMARLVSDKESVEVSQIGQPTPRPMQRRVLCEIIESRMREIVTMVRQQLDKSGHLGTLPGGVILTGGGAQLLGTDKLFDDMLKATRVRVAEPEVAARFKPQPGLATAVGLARFALQCQDEITPAAGATGWKERFRGMFGMRGR
jgi:cell division protein FtsA